MVSVKSSLSFWGALTQSCACSAAEKDLETEEWLDPGSQTLQTSTSWAPRKEGGTFLSVPLNMLQSISTYRAQYEQHLQRLSHEEVGSFNPWHVAQR